jgi:glutaredoxin
MTSDEDFLDTLSIKVVGKNKSQEIQIFTLSTCQWCKKCKRYLDERSIQYRYIDVDSIQPADKARIMDFLKNKYEERIAYPFMICDGKAIVGYDPQKYDEMLKTGD